MGASENESVLVDNFNKWASEFYPVLGLTNRWNAFCVIAVELFKLNRPVDILETGCTRVEDNWKGDGQSTRVFCGITKISEGCVTSVDNDPDACEVAEKLCPRAFIICEDSIRFLKSSESFPSEIDLLYLDSYDYNPPYALSELHHAGELAAVYEKLKSGCLIAVDDCHSEWVGKHVMVKVFFERLGIEPLYEGYITVWRKP